MLEQLSLFTEATFLEPYTVSQLTAYIRRIIEYDPELADVWVEGEVSNFSRSTAGHCYFTLKDADAQIRCGAASPSDRITCP